MMTHAVDRGSENQIFQAAMAVCGHDQQIRIQLFRRTRDLRSIAFAVLHSDFRTDSLLPQGSHNLVKVFKTFMNLRGRSQ